MTTYVVHHSEVALKGKNRPEFSRVLRRNIRRPLSRLGSAEVDSRDGRYFVETGGQDADVAACLSKVFGVAWFARAEVVQAEYAAIRDEVLRVARSSKGSFMVAARRSDKSFPLKSVELASKLGAEVVEETGRRVDLTSPASTIHVDLLKGRALVYAERGRGPGGLPVGTAGRVMHLFSGGIDSPVAAWLLMKRGCRPVYLHFYSAPTADYALEGKVGRLVRLLTEYSGRSTLVLVPFDRYQVATAGAPSDAEPSLFRRFMRVAAESLVPHFGAIAISTGDSLSQAASQTLWNLGAFDRGSSLPILRPLLGYDKEEIVDLARTIGTYEPSTEEYRDCCAMVTRHPKTRVKADLIDSLSERFGFSELASQCLSSGTLAVFDSRRERHETSPLGRLLEVHPVEGSGPRPLRLADSQEY